MVAWSYIYIQLAYRVIGLLAPSRSMILVMITIAAGGTVLIENPANSLIALHPRWVWMVETLLRHGISVACLGTGSVLVACLLSACQLRSVLQSGLLDEKVRCALMEAHMGVEQFEARGCP